MRVEDQEAENEKHESLEKIDEKDSLVGGGGSETRGCAEEKGPNGPNAFNLCQLKYVGILFNYFMVGFVPQFILNPMTYFMIQNLNATPAEQNSVLLLLNLPWCFKVVYGLISDAYAFLDYRRKSYLILGNIVGVGAMLALGFCAYTKVLTISHLGWLVFLQTAGMILSEVMADAYCVELTKQHAKTSESGRIQYCTYMTRFCAQITGSVFGVIFYNQKEWGWGLSFSSICFICAGIMCLSFPTLLLLEEDRASTRPPTEPIKNQLSKLWQVVQRRAVWQPMLYIYVYNVFQIPNAAWNSFLIKGLHFSPFEMGMLIVAANIMNALGLWIYNACLRKASWRYIYIITTVLGLAFSSFQLILVYRVNIKAGIDDFAFGFGDNVFIAFVNGIQFLIAIIMMYAMCPKNQEGASYALFTTFSNLASSCSTVFGNLAVDNLWDCSNGAMASGQWGGLGKLTILTSVIQVVPCFFVFFLPDSEEEHKQMAAKEETSFAFGSLFIFVLVGSLGCAVGNAVYMLH